MPLDVIQGSTPPVSPKSGDLWLNTANGRYYTWTIGPSGGGAWVVSSALGVAGRGPATAYMPTPTPMSAPVVVNPTPKITSADVPPSVPAVNDLWFDTRSGFLFIWYYDGNTYQWVVTNPGRGSDVPPPATVVPTTIDSDPGIILTPDPLLGIGSIGVDTTWLDNRISTATGDYLPLTGGTLTGPGNLTMAGTFLPSADGTQTQGSVTARWGLIWTTGPVIVAPPGTVKPVRFQSVSGGVATNRWVMGSNTAAEGGSNAGSDFYLQAYNDAGGSLSFPLVVTRSTGAITLTGTLTGTATVMSGSITSTGGNLVTTGGNLTIDRTGDAASALGFFSSDAGFQSGVNFRTGNTATSNRWQIIKSTTAEGGSDAGSNLQIVAYNDAGTLLSTPVTITRSTGAVALTGALTGTTATMSGSIVSTGGNMVVQGGVLYVDRVGDVAAAQMQLRTDAGQQSTVEYLTGTSLRWLLRKNSTAEGGSNTGSDFEIAARNDAGAALSIPLSITRSTGAVTLTGALTGTTATLSTAISAASNDTTVPTTAWVKANAGGGGSASISVGTTPPGSPADGAMWYYSDASSGGGQLYIRYNDGNSSQWVLANPSVGGASMTVGDTPPVSPSAGAMWWNSILGTLYVYYNDSNSSQWVPASPAATQGSLLQTVSTETGAFASGTTTIPFDDTIPQISEGTEFMTCVITPKSATSKLIINVIWNGNSNIVTPTLIVALFQDSTANALAVVSEATGQNSSVVIPLTHAMTSGTTSAMTFRVRAGSNSAGTVYMNGNVSRSFGGAYVSSIVIQEVAS